MGHQAIIYGMIEAPAAGERQRPLKVYNEAIINSLPTEDPWPSLTRAMFAFPDRWPQGTYREQIIHFGLSMKDDSLRSADSLSDGDHAWPQDREGVYGWFDKFERLLRQMFWFGANVHVSTDFEPDRILWYTPTKAAIDQMVSDHPTPIAEWELKIARIPDQAT